MDRFPLSDITSTFNEKGNGRFQQQTTLDAVKGVLLQTCCQNDCCRQLGVEEIKECRDQYWRMKMDEQRHFIFKALRNSVSLRFMVLGRDVCEKAWKAIYGVGERRYWELKKTVLRKQALTPYGDTKRIRRPSTANIQARTWLEQYVHLFSDKLPDRPEIHLPSCLTRRSVYDLYHAEMTRCQQQLLQKTAFYDMWDQVFPFVKISKGTGSQPKCTACVNLDQVLKMKIEKELRNELEEKKRIHLQLQSECRAKYYKHIKKAVESPDRYLSLIVDNMDQAKTRLPRFHSNSKAEAPLHKLQHHVTGVKVHHMKKSFILTWTDQFHPDSNITINALVYVLSEISKRNDGKLPPTLYLQMDNSGKDNKNSFLMTFLGWLVRQGVFQKIKVGFLMAGHTHEDIDQVFSRISVHLRQVNAPTLPDLIEAITGSTDPAPEVKHLEGIYDYKKGLKNCKGAIEGISGPHQFVITGSDGRVSIKYKDWPTDTVHNRVDISEIIPESLNLEPVLKNPKINAELEKMSSDLTKWEQCGRLNNQEIEWWKDYLGQHGQNRQLPNIPKVGVLPKFTSPCPAQTCDEASNLVSAINSTIEKHRKTSVLKARKRRQTSN